VPMSFIHNINLGDIKWAQTRNPKLSLACQAA
jgi:hypothetical protein